MNAPLAMQESARDAEAVTLARLQAAARGETEACDAMEASVFQMAGRLLMPRLPDAGTMLVAACHRYFERTGGLPWSVNEITARRAVIGLSRFRDGLFRAFGAHRSRAAEVPTVTHERV